jgi:mannose-1-phosphate guanylyltransferase
MKGVVLVGGEATRLRPLTCNTPKIMVPVLNRPFLEHFVLYLKAHNIVDIVLAIGKSAGQVRYYYGDGCQLGVRIVYSVEDSPLGTAGAVKNAERYLDGPFFVFNGDVFTDIDLTAMVQLHRKNKAMASLALTPVDDPTMYGVVETDGKGRVKRFLEKPGRHEATTDMINAGIYILEPDILNHIAGNTFSMFERDVFPPLVGKGEGIYAYPFHDYWIDMGTPDKYLKLQHDLLARRAADQGVEFEGESSVQTSARIKGPALIGHGCSISENSAIRGPVVLGARCHVGEGAIVEGAVLWEDCRVGRGARLTNCLVASRCQIGEGSEIPGGCVLGDDVRVGEGSRLSKGVRIWPGKAIEPGTILSRSLD